MVKRVVATFISISISLAMLFSLSNCESAREMCRCRKGLNKGEGVYVISPYDEVMKTVARESGIDWRLLSAIARTESEFRADAVSRRGALGLMQIMPHIGEHFGLSAEELADPHNNVRAAAALLEEIHSMIKVPSGVSVENALSLVLASYNGGLGHVADARRLARAHGADMNSWVDVAQYLTLKNEPEYYEQEVVSYGRFVGSRETIAYVRNVMKHYRRYCAIAEPISVDEMVCELPCPIHHADNIL
ncbi:MAG: transglycosylase [Rikenellaceae bacterium]|nr:transglycosylase [Rikenellaceae bacterium]